MSLSGIITGACAVLTATSAFDDSNISWMDPGIMDTSPCRWVMWMTLESSDPTRIVFGDATPYQGIWRLEFRTYIKYTGDPTNWLNDHKTVPQDIVDAITGDDTLDGNCTNAKISLLTPEPQEVGGRRVTFLPALLEAIELDV